jgi:hypothetical protein
VRNLEALTFVVIKMAGAGRRGALAFEERKAQRRTRRTPAKIPSAKSSRDTQTLISRARLFPTRRMIPPSRITRSTLVEVEVEVEVEAEVAQRWTTSSYRWAAWIPSKFRT